MWNWTSLSRLVSHRLSKSDRRVVMLVNTLVKVSSCIGDIIWKLDVGATSEYPATNLHILSTLQNGENRNKKNLVMCKLVAAYSAV